MSQIMGGENIDPTYALALLNVSRTGFELLDGRPLNFIKASDSTETAISGTHYTTTYAMPSPATPSIATPYLMQYLSEGTITLVSTSNPNNQITLREAAFENSIAFQGQNYFVSDYVNRTFSILANLPGLYKIWQFFIADFGDITDTTSWNGIPPRFHPALAFDAVARFRLGTDYDDLAARNADQNFKTAAALIGSLKMLDARIAQQQATNRSFVGRDGSAFTGDFPAPGANRGYGYGI